MNEEDLQLAQALVAAQRENCDIGAIQKIKRPDDKSSYFR